MPPEGQAVACPFCGSVDTELIALFGQTLLASQYWCRGCHTGFDRVRWRSDTDRAVGVAEPADRPGRS